MALGFGECLSMKAECATFWAGWGVIATAAVGVVTVLVALLAWLTSRRAAKIAEQATRIAERQHEDVACLSRETGRIVGRLLIAEVATITPRAARVARAMREAPDGHGESIRYLHGTYYDQAIYEARQDLLPTAESVIERIHTLPASLGPDLAALIAACRTLKALAERVDVNALRTTTTTAGKSTSYVDVSRVLVDWLNLQDQAIWILRFSAQFSDEFHSFVGVPKRDYAHNLEEFSSYTIH
ncbi:hypothetical protein [Stenotrophomonas maltophilia]|uniref:hypothetical protein n=1 Tax=Stenotrophomonas maltophilia TaxID=40324 RepID=UPI0012B0B291|nr:hypothetical protein [Stenotrophomonas maltophilia]QGL71725.1 hypothetical protein FEO85_09760 [Stenotrophomonas maltophilia]